MEQQVMEQESQMITRVFAVGLAPQQSPSTADPPVVHLAGLSSVSETSPERILRDTTQPTQRYLCAGPGASA